MSIHTAHDAICLFMSANACPHCGSAPDLDPAFHGQFCIFCPNDDCPSGEMQAMGFSLAETVGLWNSRTQKRISYHG